VQVAAQQVYMLGLAVAGLVTSTKTIQPQKSETLLGGIILNEFKFNAHLKDDENQFFAP
jgi:hypothetical protein